MALQTLTFAAFISFHSVKAQEAPCKIASLKFLDEDTVFSAAMKGDSGGSIAVNQKGAIQVWTPTNIRQWTKSNKEGDADPSSPVEISNDGKFVAFVDKSGFTVGYDQTLRTSSFKRKDIDKATSISLSTDASTMAVGNTKSVIVYHYNITGRHWDRFVIPFHALPDIQSIYVKLNSIGTALVVTRFTISESFTETFKFNQESGLISWKPFGGVVSWSWVPPKALSLKNGQSVISITDNADKMAISGKETSVYTLNGGVWSPPKSIPKAISNSMTDDGKSIVVGFLTKNTEIFDWKYNDFAPQTDR